MALSTSCQLRFISLEMPVQQRGALWAGWAGCRGWAAAMPACRAAQGHPHAPWEAGASQHAAYTPLWLQPLSQIRLLTTFPHLAAENDGK